MEMTTPAKKKKPPLVVRILLGILLAAAGLLLAALIAVWALWHNEIGTFLTIKELAPYNGSHKDGATYYIDMKGGYYFDDFLKKGGASSDDQIIDFLVGHITHGLIPMEITPGKVACSVFTAELENGGRVFGRNYDMSSERATAIVHTKPGHGRHESYSTIDFSFLGVGNEGPVTPYQKLLSLAAAYVPLDGVNDAGVSAAILVSNQGVDGRATDQNTARPDITSSTLIRLILDYADDVEEAIALAEQYDMHDSAGRAYHYVVADASGHSAALEWINDTFVKDNDAAARTLRVTRSDDSGVQIVTNYIVADGYYDGCPADTKIHGLDRYQYLEKKLKAAGGVLADEDEAMALLDGVSRRDWVTKALTIHSAVYNLTERTVLWVGNEHYGEGSHTFRFGIGK